jgi:hypothetical protein
MLEPPKSVRSGSSEHEIQTASAPEGQLTDRRVLERTGSDWKAPVGNHVEAKPTTSVELESLTPRPMPSPRVTGRIQKGLLETADLVRESRRSSSRACNFLMSPSFTSRRSDSRVIPLPRGP